MKFHPELAPYVTLPVSVGVALSYVALGLLGNKLMESRSALDLTALKVGYNVTQIVVCSCTFMGLLPFFIVRSPLSVEPTRVALHLPQLVPASMRTL